MSWRECALLLCVFTWACVTENPTDPDAPLSEEEADLEFAGFELEDGSEIDPDDDAAHGSVEVTTELSVNRTSALTGPVKVRLEVDGQVKHEETVQPRQQPSFQHTFTYTLDTDELDPATRVARYFNGAHTFAAEVVNEAGTVVKRIVETVEFENPDRVDTSVTLNAIRTANDAAGNTWTRGGVNLAVQSALYTPGRTATGAEVEIGGSTWSASLAAGSASFFLEGERLPSEGIGGLTITPGDVAVVLNTNQGPIQSTVDLRVDNGAPIANGANVVLPPSGWLDSDAIWEKLAERLERAVDEGVGDVGLEFRAALKGSSSYEVIEDPAELGESSTNDAFTIRGFAVDGLGNATELPGGGTVGRDATPAAISIAEGSPPANTVIPSGGQGTVTFLVTDEQSGVPSTNPVLGTLTRLAVGISGETACVIGVYDPANAGDPCGIAPMGISVEIPPEDGFWKLSYRSLDVAGNQGEPASALYLRDEQPPTIAGGSAILTSSGAVEYTFTALDNVGLARTTVYNRLPFGSGSISLSTAPYKQLGEWGEISAELSVAYTAQPITSIQLLDGSHAPVGTPQGTLNYIVEVVDHVGLPTLADIAVLQSLPPGADARTRGVESWRLFASSPRVCNGDHDAGPCPPDAPPQVEVTLQATTSEAAGSNPPFESTYLWLLDPVLQRFLVMVEAVEPEAFPTADGYTWRWEMPLIGDGLTPQSQAIVLAGGLTADGNLLLTNPVAFQIISGSY